MTGFLSISNDTLHAEISPNGAALARLWLSGHDTSLVLGLPTAKDYRNAPHAIGVIVGPVAGRISGARTTLNGVTYALPDNTPPDTLHSGPEGIQHLEWTVEAHSDVMLRLSITLPNGACGLPGNRTITATYTLTEAALSLDIMAQTDADTLINATSHAYWTLDGSGDLSNHHLTLATARMLETGADLIPTGQILNQSGTDHDFTNGKSPVDCAPLDGCFCLSEAPTEGLRDVMTLTAPHSGLTLNVATDQPGLVLYTAENMPELSVPAGLPPIGPFSAVAIEAQGWPDAANQAKFPSIVLKSGAVLHQRTRFSLSRT